MATQNFQLIHWDGTKQKRANSENMELKLGKLAIGSLADIREVSGKLDFGGVAITNLAAPLVDSDAATKKFVDDAIAAVNAGSISSLQAEIDAVEGDLAQEVIDRAAGDSSTLSSANSYTDTKVAALVNSAPAILDTLKELADALGGDANFATTITNSIAAVQAEVDAEETARAAAITAEATARAAADTTLDGKITTEKNRAEAAEAALQGEIDAVEADVVAEETRALAAEAALDGRLDVIEGSGAGSVAKALVDAKAYADAAVLVEKGRAETAEAGLQSDINDVASDLTAEETRALAAEAALDGRLDVLEGSGAGSVAKALVDAKAYTDAEVLVEKSRALAAEAAIQAEVDAEETARAAAVAAVQAEVDALEVVVDNLNFITKTADETILAGQVCYIKSNGNIALADADLDLSENALVIAHQNISSASSGKVVLKEGTVVGGFSSLTPGKKCYVSKTAGALVQNLTGFVAGNSVYCVGRAISASQIAFAPVYEFEY